MVKVDEATIRLKSCSFISKTYLMLLLYISLRQEQEMIVFCVRSILSYFYFLQFHSFICCFLSFYFFIFFPFIFFVLLQFYSFFSLVFYLVNIHLSFFSFFFFLCVIGDCFYFIIALISASLRHSHFFCVFYFYFI